MAIDRNKITIIKVESAVLGLKPSQINMVVRKADSIVKNPSSKWYQSTQRKAQANNRELYAQAMHEAHYVLKDEFDDWDEDLATYLELTGEEKKDFKTVGRVFRAPSEKDYEKGWIWRHFVSRYNDNIASEVTAEFFKEEFDNLPKGLYKKSKIRWYIKEGVNHEKKVIYETVNAANLNRSNVEEASKKMPQIGQTLKDYSQFVR